jgi:AcrR family transcriptional regulator
VPRAGVTTDAVVAQAMVVVDEVGFDRLTLAAVAERLGVRLPSLYKHVEGLEAVRTAVAARSKDELAAVLASSAVGRAGADALRSMSVAYRTWALAHPGRYAGTVRAPAAGAEREVDAAARATEVVFGVLRAYELEGDDLVDATRALRATLHGFVAIELAGGFGLPTDVDRSFERAVDGLVAVIEHSVRDRLP